MDRNRFRSSKPVERGNYLSRPVQAAQPSRPTIPLSHVEAPGQLTRGRAVIDVAAGWRHVLDKRKPLQGLLHMPHTSKQRFVAGNLAFLILVGLFIQILDPVTSSRAYALSPQAEKLIGGSRDDASKYLALNEDKTAYTFVVPDASEGAGAHGGRNASAYETTLNLDAGKGITYTDTKTKISITVTPKFGTTRGEKVSGDNIVYPSGVDKLVYTHKYNGLKEDIIVPAFRKDNLKYSFKLSLPIGAEARLDKQGNIGIYSGDTSLYGNIQFGSDKDRATIDKARANSAKNNLVATIPYPIVKDATGKQYGDRATFSLSGKTVTEAEIAQDVPAEVAKQVATNGRFNTYELGITTKNIKNLKYPISVDPTIQLTDTNDFLKGNLDGIDHDQTNGLIKRASLSGGSVGSWTTSAQATPSVGVHITNFYNGKIYLENSGDIINFATVDPDTGDVGPFTSTGRTSVTGVGKISNGYYWQVEGGANNNRIYSAKINADGTLPAFTLHANSSATGHQRASTTIYNGYIYTLGGFDRTGTGGALDPFVDTYKNTVQYAKINGDGSIGTFANTSPLTSVRAYTEAMAYNGYIYSIGGTNDSTSLSTVSYASINKDGSIGTWANTTATPLNTFAQGNFVSNGYMYLAGGYNGTSGSDRTAVYYAQINADGTLGGWTATTSFNTARRYAGFNAYNGYLYLTGGQSGTTTVTSYGDIQYAKIDPAGVTAPARTEAASFTTARSTHGAAIINGYIYVIGGCTVQRSLCDTNAETLDTVYYAQIDTSTGVIGAWASTTKIPAARGKLAVTFINSYIYVLGGNGNCGALSAYSDVCNNVYYATPAGNGTISAWSTGTALSGSRASGAAVAYNDQIYYLGGRSSTSTITNSVLRSPVDPTSGSNGSWAAGTNLTSPVELLAAATYGGFIYIQGGFNGTDNENGRLAQIFPDGTIGAWEPTITSFAQRDGANLVAYNGYLYYFGGYDGTTGIRLNIEYAQIKSDGRLEGFVQSPNGILASSHHAGAIAYAGRIYSTGGVNASNAVVATTDSFPVNNGGSGMVQSWTARTSLNTVTTSHYTVVYNGYVYVIGGDTGSNIPTTRVERASISKGGVLSSWTILAGSALPEARYGTAAAVINGYVYIIGGNTGPGAYSNLVRYAKFNADGTISTDSCGMATTWCSPTALLPAGWGFMGSASYNRRIYLSGGNNNGVFTNTSFATPTSTGDITAWIATTSLPEGRYWGPAMAAANGYMYALSGCGTSTCGSNYVASNISAPINADGTLGVWTKIGNMPTPRRFHTATVYNGYLYVIGGENVSIVQYAAITTGGSLGPWQIASSTTTPRTLHGSFASDGYLFVVGATTESASVQVMERRGSYTRLIDFERGVLPTKLITRGAAVGNSALSLVYITTTNAGASLNNVQMGENIGYGSSNGLPFVLGTNVSTTRYLQLKYTLSDSEGSIFPDAAGGQSTITDYDVYFTANPGSRLRGGQAFVSGQDRGLQATR